MGCLAACILDGPHAHVRVLVLRGPLSEGDHVAALLRVGDDVTGAMGGLGAPPPPLSTDEADGLADVTPACPLEARRYISASLPRALSPRGGDARARTVGSSGLLVVAVPHRAGAAVGGG